MYKMNACIGENIALYSKDGIYNKNFIIWIKVDGIKKQLNPESSAC